MKTHLTRFRVTYITAFVAVMTSTAAEFTSLRDLPSDQLHTKTWIFWLVSVAIILGNAGNTVLAALHAAPDEPEQTKKEPTP